MHGFQDYLEFAVILCVILAALPTSRLKPALVKLFHRPFFLEGVVAESKPPPAAPTGVWRCCGFFFLFVYLVDVIATIFMPLNVGAHCYPFPPFSHLGFRDLCLCHPQSIGVLLNNGVRVLAN